MDCGLPEHDLLDIENTYDYFNKYYIGKIVNLESLGWAE